MGNPNFLRVFNFAILC